MKNSTSFSCFLVIYEYSAAGKIKLMDGGTKWRSKSEKCFFTQCLKHKKYFYYIEFEFAQSYILMARS